MYFSADSIPNGRAEFKCCPPVRDSAQQDALWQALIDGHIDLVVSDHSPSNPALKSDNLHRSWGGISGLQTSLSVVWTAGRSRGVQLEMIAQWMAKRPAEQAGISHRKGEIAVGMDADFCVFEPDAQFVVDGRALLHRHKMTPYANERLYGVVRKTVLRSRVVYDRETGVVGPARGEIVTRPSAADAADPARIT